MQLWTTTFEQAYRDVHTADNIRAYCRENYSLEAAVTVLSSTQFDCTIAYDNDLPVGYGLIHYQTCPAPLAGASCELKQIYILSSQYGSGLGRLLFEHALQIARQACCQWLWLCVSNLNARAQRFYQKLDFAPIAPGPLLMVGSDLLPSTILAVNIDD
ncbi:MAG: GNAT family N-acetyltransferase [Leptolyngbya sp. SIOISBB]|nr:GNAT family N-acetyltransferase [Leptolyngbya sp. SIOISBB]